MMLKPQDRKRGSPQRAVNYLFATVDAKGVSRKNMELICGSPQTFVQIASKLNFCKPYDSLVISFASSDAPTPRQIGLFLRDFERTAFPSMRDRVCWMVVMHENEISSHLHVLVAQVDLLSGKQFSVLAHGARPLRQLCEQWNLTMHWASVHDPFRARLASWADEVHILHESPDCTLPMGTPIHDHCRKQAVAAVLAGLVNCQADMVREMGKIGEVVRTDIRSITVNLPGIEPRPKTGSTHVRLAGLLYAKAFNLALVLSMLAPTPMLPRFWKRNEDEDDLQRASKLRANLALKTAKHAIEFRRRFSLNSKRARHSIITEIAIATERALPAFRANLVVFPNRHLFNNSPIESNHERQFTTLCIDDPVHPERSESVFGGGGADTGRKGAGGTSSRPVSADLATVFKGAFRRAFDAAVDRILREPLEQLLRRLGGAARASGAGVGTDELPGDRDSNRVTAERATAARSFLKAQKKKPFPTLER